MYYRGLKDNVKDKIVRANANTSTLKNIIRAAIDIDDRLYKRAIEKRYLGHYRR